MPGWLAGVPPQLRTPAVDWLQADNETNPLKFSQTFHLAPVGGSYVVTNDLFRCGAGCHVLI
jgi:hypothetical protein